jgi:hypothetical protein
VALVRNPCNKPWRPIGLRDVEVPTFCLDNRLIDGGEVVSLTRRPPLTSPREDFLVLILLEAESTPGAINAAGRLIEKLNELVGNRTRGLTAC